ncbi:MAG: threonine/serine exporter family protein, partial [Firmicutes bacterium]|nr:threonine/serine exporter family protein [Bacillota bacterium]
LLSCGTGAWRVRNSMNTLSEQLGITCSANIGLMSIDYTCFDGENCFSQSLCLSNTGVNTSKLNRLENFVNEFSDKYIELSGEQIHSFLDSVEQIHRLYSPFALGMAAAIACGGFTFLLGGGIVEIICAFLGAGFGNYLRCKLNEHHFTIFMNIVLSIIVACFVYAMVLKFTENVFSVSVKHEAGYICAMLFIIPGFPFITSGIDMAKLDLRSGIERLAYSIIIILVATMFAWIMAMALHLKPVEFVELDLSGMLLLIFRLITSFCGVFGFSIMFNSSVSMAATAALIGSVANTLRLELIDITGMPPAAAAFAGALTAGVLASLIKRTNGYPRISVTVPSIVIMVPGLYLYRAIYNFGIMSLTDAFSWFSAALLIIIALPLGLIFARILTDKTFRYCT